MRYNRDSDVADVCSDIRILGIVPDILAIGKGMGGGLPVGGFVSSLEKMRTFLDNPKMGACHYIRRKPGSGRIVSGNA